MQSPDREIELKLELAPGDATRVLEHPAVRRSAVGPPQVQHLVSVYFDTPDHALARAGIGVRLRRSPQGQVQTVKSREDAAAGLFVRGEIETPVAGEQPDLGAIPDESLRAQILDALDGQPLVPVFETEMRRTHRLLRDGEDEWHLDLDEGVVRAGALSERFCELELELRHGDVVRLYELALELSQSFDLVPGTRSKAERGYTLRSGGHPPASKAPRVELAVHATLDTALREVTHACLAQIGGNVAAAWDGVDSEGVHQMRVGVRRMRSVFSVFQPVLPAEPTRVLRDHLRWLSSELGTVRDLDVFIDELLVPLFGVRNDDPALKRLRDEAEQLREERKRTLRTALHSRRQSRLLLELGHWISRSAWREQALSESSAMLFQRADGYASQVLSRLQRKAEKLAPEALTGPPASRHELRIALKKLRYACEFFRGLYPKKDVKRHLQRLSKLQDLLGALNDIVTAGRVLEELLSRVGREEAAQLARAAGFIEGFAARQDEIALRELAAQWERFVRTREFWERD